MSAPVELRLEGRLRPEQTFSTLLLPFEVPAGTARIDVHYVHSDAIGSDPMLVGGSTLDIGIFDARGADFMTAGFRGWSGSARASFFITPEAATPGYMPGPLLPGVWHICLGLYKIPEHGCEYAVTIRLTAGDTRDAQFPPLLSLSRSAKRAANPSGWYRGELHCHTIHSDGDSAPLDVAARAEALGLDFLAITDHNVLTQQIDLRESQTPLILIPGFEVTTYYGHWNVWGAGGWLDFRIGSAEQMRAAMRTAAARGYLVSCNHPRPYGPDWAFPEVTDYDCIEVWNGPWELFNDRALAYWEERLRAGARPTAVGGSDCHFHQREHLAWLGHPTTWIYCEGAPSAAALLAALRAGRATISESPVGPQIDLRAGGVMVGGAVELAPGAPLALSAQVRGGRGDVFELHGEGGPLIHMQIRDDPWHASVLLDSAQSRYVYARVTGANGLRALTNPIYLTSTTG
ncbi:MAG: CehA/McbA family metallohydrolase [Aggregatilineales bacterium]